MKKKVPVCNKRLLVFFALFYVFDSSNCWIEDSQQLYILILKHPIPSYFVNMFNLGSAVLTASLLTSLQKEVLAVVTADKVTSLPGFAGALPSDHYSGYLPVGELSGSKGHLHYWLIESEVSIYML